jgi:hypothetical protein
VKQMPVPDESDLLWLGWDEEFAYEDMSKDWWITIPINQPFTEAEIEEWLKEHATVPTIIQGWVAQNPDGTRRTGTGVTFHYEADGGPIAQAEAANFKLRWG